MQLALQQIHQRFVQPGPLVLRSGPLKFPTPTTDRDRTVSRRSEPSSRATLIGEQPTLGPSSAPGWASRHRGAKPLRRCELLGVISLLSPEYLLSFERRPFIRNRRITIPNFRSCSTCKSHSQAPLCYCTLRMVTKHAEVPLKPPIRFWRRPPQSNYPPNTVSRITGIRHRINKGGISTVAPRFLAKPLRSLPPILHIVYQCQC